MTTPVDKETREEALTLALKSADIFGVKLDFSDLSIKRLEKILDKISKDYQLHKKEEEASKTGFIFATYIVEVVERNHPGKKGVWNVDDEEMGTETYPYVFSDGSRMFPFAWCMKRIVDGKGDDVWFKYQALILNKYYDDPR